MVWYVAHSLSVFGQHSSIHFLDDPWVKGSLTESTCMHGVFQALFPLVSSIPGYLMGERKSHRIKRNTWCVQGLVHPIQFNSWMVHE